ncbi:hypothetical protein NRM5_004620 [Chlamydia psittaci]|nr:hypothetical protein NRM5_004620 [Chlamydia psittaci]
MSYDSAYSSLGNFRSSLYLFDELVINKWLLRNAYNFSSTHFTDYFDTSVYGMFDDQLRSEEKVSLG